MDIAPTIGLHRNTRSMPGDVVFLNVVLSINAFTLHEHQLIEPDMETYWMEE